MGAKETQGNSLTYIFYATLVKSEQRGRVSVS